MSFLFQTLFLRFIFAFVSLFLCINSAIAAFVYTQTTDKDGKQVVNIYLDGHSSDDVGTSESLSVISALMNNASVIVHTEKGDSSALLSANGLLPLGASQDATVVNAQVENTAAINAKNLIKSALQSGVVSTSSISSILNWEHQFSNVIESGSAFLGGWSLKTAGFSAISKQDFAPGLFTKSVESGSNLLGSIIGLNSVDVTRHLTYSSTDKALIDAVSMPDEQQVSTGGHGANSETSFPISGIVKLGSLVFLALSLAWVGFRVSKA
jgi:hypothetical protein